jgi:hypothetical protein
MFLQRKDRFPCFGPVRVDYISNHQNWMTRSNLYLKNGGSLYIWVYAVYLRFLVGWDWVHSVLRPLLAFCTCSSATLATAKPTWSDPGSTPGRRSGKPATKRLSYGTACVFTFVRDALPWSAGPEGNPIKLPASRNSARWSNTMLCSRIIYFSSFMRFLCRWRTVVQSGRWLLTFCRKIIQDRSEDVRSSTHC